MAYIDTPKAPCALCPCEKGAHVIGADEDCDSPECGPHGSFCMGDCDESDHEWTPVPGWIEPAPEPFPYAYRVYTRDGVYQSP